MERSSVRMEARGRTAGAAGAAPHGSPALDAMRAYRGKRVLITGGLGFLGSTLADRLCAAGAEVTVVDSLNPLYGGNRYNVRGVRGALTTVVHDLRDLAAVRPHIEAADYIFHLAAQVSYIDSLSMPLDDLMLNAGLTLQLLEECRRLTVKPTLVFASSRMVVGKVDQPLVTEDSPANPLTLYGVHKLASEKYLAIYHQTFDIPTLALRITNPYGPRQQIHHNRYCMVGWFIRQALENRTIQVFGDGLQRRDYVYIDDLAEAFLRCALSREALGGVVNIGSGVATRFRDMVETVVDVVGQGRVDYVPWPRAYERIETGDVVADLSRLHQLTGWHSRVDLRAGVARTAEYYRRHWHHYVRDAEPPARAVSA
ncbi:MAG: NAD-dependent epimerase/dehydratase family protein [Deltaproteobacteria bacterium]|nr:NAD-dependent epimerase/dehydratase family protein [Deltaproteobacteria bacterium]